MLLAKMTLEKKLGQMTQAEQSALKNPSDIENYFLGSLLSGGSSDPKAGNSMRLVQTCATVTRAAR